MVLLTGLQSGHTTRRQTNQMQLACYAAFHCIRKKRQDTAKFGYVQKQKQINKGRKLRKERNKKQRRKN